MMNAKIMLFVPFYFLTVSIANGNFNQGQSDYSNGRAALSQGDCGAAIFYLSKFLNAQSKYRDNNPEFFAAIEQKITECENYLNSLNYYMSPSERAEAHRIRIHALTPNQFLYDPTSVMPPGVSPYYYPFVPIKP